PFTATVGQGLHCGGCLPPRRPPQQRTVVDQLCDRWSSTFKRANEIPACHTTEPSQHIPPFWSSKYQCHVVRLWTLHPKYLDAQGLVALWREGLLARAVLKRQTKGYRRHPQLARFRAHPSPLSAINAYLRTVLIEAEARGYAFDRRKI